VHAETGDGWFAPPPLLHRLVSAGRRGAGRGGGFREEGGR